VGGTFTRAANPNFNVANWHQCEVVVKEAGEFKAACCPVGEGGAACKGVLVLSWKGPGKKHPFNIMIHNPGLFDQYREICWKRTRPTRASSRRSDPVAPGARPEQPVAPSADQPPVPASAGGGAGAGAGGL
jgi:hypothetical protein